MTTKLAQALALGFARPGDEGLGDTLKRVIEAARADWLLAAGLRLVGVDPRECGCEGRRLYLNEKFPYSWGGKDDGNKA